MKWTMLTGAVCVAVGLGFFGLQPAPDATVKVVAEEGETCSSCDNRHKVMQRLQSVRTETAREADE